jgi:hypothetical protein
MGVPSHGLEAGVEKRLTPALEVEVLDERQIRAEPVPVLGREITFEPAVVEDRARAHGAPPGATARDLDL